MLTAKGLDPAAAGRAATNLVGRMVTGQSTVIAFDAAFAAVALLFLFAAPLLIGIKIVLARHAKMRTIRRVELPQAHPKSGIHGRTFDRPVPPVLRESLKL